VEIILSSEMKSEVEVTVIGWRQLESSLSYLLPQSLFLHIVAPATRYCWN